MGEAGDRLVRLQGLLADMKEVVVAFSGGVDSAFLFRVACDVLGRNAVAVTALSPIQPGRLGGEAARIAEEVGGRHLVIETNELNDPEFRKNPPDRCYVCKKALFSRIVEFAKSEGLGTVVDGSNASDLDDYRPGMRALRELGIRSPLAEVGLTKSSIRRLAREMGMSNWDRPAATCLATRIPYGEEITLERLCRVDEAEEIILSLGFGQVRVRDHGEVARIEVEPGEVRRLTSDEIQPAAVSGLKKLGFRYVCADLEGYRTGSLNESLELGGGEDGGSAGGEG